MASMQRRAQKIQKRSRTLALGELEPLASTLLTVLLALVLARIPGKEAGLLELRPSSPLNSTRARAMPRRIASA